MAYETKEILEKLEDGIRGLLDGEEYKKYLQFISKFHSYSFCNTILIKIQKPDAQLVAGFNTWKEKHKRFVKKGEKGIKILAPMVKKITTTNDDGEEEEVKKAFGYKAVTVFDVSQTGGEDLPTIKVNELNNTVEDFNKYRDILIKIAPCEIKFENIEGIYEGTKGYYMPSENKITIKADMSELQTLKTMVHEIAHSMIHNSEEIMKRGIIPSDEEKETEAESIAFTVLSYLGLDTSDYSFGYLTSWSNGNIKIFKNAVENIKKTSSKIIELIENELNKAA